MIRFNIFRLFRPFCVPQLLILTLSSQILESIRDKKKTIIFKFFKSPLFDVKLRSSYLFWFTEFCYTFIDRTFFKEPIIKTRNYVYWGITVLGQQKSILAWWTTYDKVNRTEMRWYHIFDIVQILQPFVTKIQSFPSKDFSGEKNLQVIPAISITKVQQIWVYIAFLHQWT